MRQSYSIPRVVLTLAPLVMALALAMDIFIPAVPKLTRLFDVPASEMQLTLSLFILTCGVAQLVIGPISDRIGRRKSCFAAIVIFTIGTLLCACSQSVWELISARIIQAIGACGMLVVSMAIVRDLFHGVASSKTYSYLNGIIAFSPMFAPFIGSHLDIYFNWQATFLFLLLVAALSFISIKFFIEETLTTPKKLNQHIFNDYRKILIHPTFFLYALGSGIGFTYLFIFCSISPYIIIDLLHIPEARYGLYFCYMGISFFIGSFLSGIIVGKIGIYRTVVSGFFLTLLGGILMTVWYLITGLTINNFIWPMLLIGIGGTVNMGAGGGGAMEPFGEHAGRAAAVMGGFQFIFISIVGYIVMLDGVHSVLPLALPAIVLSIIGIFLFFRYRARLDFAKYGHQA